MHPPNLNLIYINAYTKFYHNPPICSEDIAENIFLRQSMAIALLFINEISPFAISNHSSPISMAMQSLNNIGQKILESGNKALTDGRPDRRTDGQTLKRSNGIR